MITGALHLDLLGVDGLTNGVVEHAFRHAVVTTIYGGSSEVSARSSPAADSAFRAAADELPAASQRRRP